jgi:hypothetical protein
MEDKSMKELLLDAGVPEEDIRTWCSDIHVKSTEASRGVLETYRYKNNVKPFVSRLDKTQWFDIPFAYPEYHSKRS